MVRPPRNAAVPPKSWLLRLGALDLDLRRALGLDLRRSLHLLRGSGHLLHRARGAS